MTNLSRFFGTKTRIFLTGFLFAFLFLGLIGSLTAFWGSRRTAKTDGSIEWNRLFSEQPSEERRANRELQATFVSTVLKRMELEKKRRTELSKNDVSQSRNFDLADESARQIAVETRFINAPDFRFEDHRFNDGWSFASSVFPNNSSVSSPSVSDDSESASKEKRAADSDDAEATDESENESKSSDFSNGESSEEAKTPECFVRSEKIVVQNQPVLLRLFNEQSVQEFFRIIESKRTSSILQAPKVTVFDKQNASVCDLTDRPFVSGVFPLPIPIPGETEIAWQPIDRILEDGFRLGLTPTLADDGSIEIDADFNIFHIRKTDACVRLDEHSTPDGEPAATTLQTPIAERQKIQLSRLSIPKNMTLVVAFPASNDSELDSPNFSNVGTSYFVITPREIKTDDEN